MNKQYITPNEFAEIFQISTRTIHRYIEQIRAEKRPYDDMPFVQIGGKRGPIRINLQKYIEMNKKV